jgi:AAA+ ATPase superfamily predicted ATPase
MEVCMFVGRGLEIEQLRALRGSKGSNIAILYGRRRVGKTSLVKEAYKAEHILCFEGLEGQSKAKQIANFLFQLKQQCPNALIDYSITSWSEALKQLTPILKKKNHVLFLDEFQWMASYRDELISELKMMWDQYFSKIDGTTLVLCGSIASFMLRKVVRSKALYGRVDLEINLKPFQIFEAKEMLKSHGNTEVVESVLLLGGIPLYLKLVKNAPSLYLGINELAFKTNSYFSTEFEKIFVSHFGKNDNYGKIIRALSKNSYGMFREQISNKCNIPLSGNLSADLFNLEAAGFIRSYTPVDKIGKSKIMKFALVDPYLIFYLKFIEPNLKNIAIGKPDIFSKITQTASFASFLGRSFEVLCQNHAYIISQILGFSGVEYSVGPYFRKSTEDAGVQIDLMFDRQDNVITLCEMKYSRSPVGIDVIGEVEKKVREIEKISKKTIQKVLIVKDHVSNDLVKSGYFYKIITCHDLLEHSRPR